MEGGLIKKEAGIISVADHEVEKLPGDMRDLPIGSASEKLGHIGSYSLNDYFLSRGFASIHVSGVGTLGSTGYMTSGDYLVRSQRLVFLISVPCPMPLQQLAWMV